MGEKRFMEAGTQGAFPTLFQPGRHVLWVQPQLLSCSLSLTLPRLGAPLTVCSASSLQVLRKLRPHGPASCGDSGYNPGTKCSQTNFTRPWSQRWLFYFPFIKGCKLQ